MKVTKATVLIPSANVLILEPASGGGETELASPAGPANGTVPVVEGGYCGGFKSKACNII